MGKYVISINQFADFQKATEKGKQRIIKQQKNPSKIKVSYYQLAKGGIKKSLCKGGAVDCIKEAINELTKRNPIENRKKTDRMVSIEALNRFLALKLPKILKLPGITFLKKSDYKNSTTINGVDIIVAPDLVFTATVDGKQIVGGLKLHVSKSKAFDRHQQQTIASGIYQFLKREVVKGSQIADPEWCLSLDIFGGGYVRITIGETDLISRDKTIYSEIKRIWDAA